MTGTSSKTSKTNTPLVEVVVVVNHDDLRRGERGVVELTDIVRGRLEKGYLRLAEPEETEPGLPPAAPLGATSQRGREPRGVLLGVDGIPGSVVVGTGGGGNDQSGTVHATA